MRGGILTRSISFYSAPGRGSGLQEGADVFDGFGRRAGDVLVEGGVDLGPGGDDADGVGEGLQLLEEVVEDEVVLRIEVQEDEVRLDMIFVVGEGIGDFVAYADFKFRETGFEVSDGGGFEGLAAFEESGEGGEDDGAGGKVVLFEPGFAFRAEVFGAVGEINDGVGLRELMEDFLGAFGGEGVGEEDGLESGGDDGFVHIDQQERRIGVAAGEEDFAGRGNGLGESHAGKFGGEAIVAGLRGCEGDTCKAIGIGEGGFEKFAILVETDWDGGLAEEEVAGLEAGGELERQAGQGEVVLGGEEDALLGVEEDGLCATAQGGKQDEAEQCDAKSIHNDGSDDSVTV